MSPSTRALWAAAVLALGACADSPGQGGVLGDIPATASPAEDPQVWSTVADFELTRADGASVSLDDLRGRPWALSTIFTSCAGPCPRITGAVSEAADSLADTEVQFVSLSVDPARDTPEVLSEYAALHGADPARWWFLTGSQAEIYRLITGSFRLAVGDRAQGHQISHDRRLAAVDREGRVRGWYDHEGDFDLFLERMRFLDSE